MLVSFCLTATAQNKLSTGIWRGVLQLNDSTELPFNFEIKNEGGVYSMEIINQEERIKVTELNFKKDSLFITLPVFNSEFVLKNESTTLTGQWINRNRPQAVSIPFRAI